MVQIGYDVIKSNEAVSLDKYLEQSKKILIIRRIGGVGDMLASRMIFEDLKGLCGSEFQIFYAVPEKYIPLVIDHPYIDGVLAAERVNLNDFFFVKDITHKAGNYEAAMAPNVDKHRADIWSEYIGLKLTHHEGHIRINHQEKIDATWFVKERGKGRKIVGIMPYSAHPSKDWDVNEGGKIQRLINLLNENGYVSFVFHDKETAFENAENVFGLDLRKLIAVVSKIDIAVTVATAMFHLANLLHKPTVAIFGCEDLDVFAKYFPECVKLQRRKEDGEKWKHCPCWDARRCKIKEHGVYPPACLEDISPEEVFEAVKKIENR